MVFFAVLEISLSSDFSKINLNLVFGKILVLELWVRVLSANQIVRFFKVQYLMNKVWDEIDFLHADKPQSFLRVGATFFVGVVRHADKFKKGQYLRKDLMDCLNGFAEVNQITLFKVKWILQITSLNWILLSVIF